MPEPKQERPHLIPLLTLLLLIQVPVLLLLGLNLLTDQWTFLFSWRVFSREVSEAFNLMLIHPGEPIEDALLFYNLVAFGVLDLAAACALVSGILLHRGGVFSWIMGLAAQIVTLGIAIFLYLVYQPSQAFWLMAIGIMMVLYLNDGSVRQWLLQSEEYAEEQLHG